MSSSTNRFLGKPEYFEIEGIGKIPLLPLRPKDIILFRENASPEEQLKANQEILRRRCGEENLDENGKINFKPFFTNDEIDSMDWQTYSKILNKLMEISGLTEQNEQIRRIREAQKKNIQQKQR